MGKQKSSKTIQCAYFIWKVFKRGSVFYADGRTGAKNLGKHSLNAKSEEEALKNLQNLDRVKAKELGLIQDNPVTSNAVEACEPIGIEDGWQRFLGHCSRPAIMRGVSPRTLKRYRAVRDKHQGFCQAEEILTWQSFGHKQAESYGVWLTKRNYADRSVYLELMLLVSIVKWLVGEKLLPAECRFHLDLETPHGTDTYCYTRQQVVRILEFCRTSAANQWLRPILTALATTGMRIGELISLRWSDLDLTAKSIRIADERYSRRKEQKGRVRTTKGKQSRTVPLNPGLKEILAQIERHPDGFVFHGPKGARLRDKKILDVFKRRIRDTLKSEFPTMEGEVGFEHGTIHSFRHYFVSEAFRQRATEAEIMDWVGHKDSEMVRHYRHLRPDDGHRRMQSINFIEDDSVSASK